MFTIKIVGADSISARCIFRINQRFLSIVFYKENGKAECLRKR